MHACWQATRVLMSMHSSCIWALSLKVLTLFF
jgi:hypothetical protein